MSSHCVIHHWLIDIASSSLIHQQTGEQRRLGEYQFRLLLVLAQNAGQILTREELNTLVWERRVIGNNSLPNAIHALRVALEDDGKQQRIIKTIPRKGYILEAEFCEFGLDEQQSPEERGHAAEPDGVNASLTTPYALSAIPHAREQWQKESQKENLRLTQQREEKRQRFWRGMCLAQVVLLLLVMIFLSLTGSEKIGERLNEQDTGLYSQIRIYALTRANDMQMTGEDISGAISPTLTALNEVLSNQHMKMQVFYSTTSTTLKYTLLISNTCDRRQLAMNIGQFRSNTALLNTLIYRETERKINEMANCLSQSDGPDVNDHRRGAGDQSVHAGSAKGRPVQ
ncbi:transcriptional regulator [Erwinia papayae]|uniref:Transcriptional regulator n=1 Tax=Erwinia papayae TaxID=206499 RepID=A0ABV3MZ68_9GAMM